MVFERDKKIKRVHTGIKEIADRLAISRKKAGYITRKQFALQNGIPPTTYQKHESGERNILANSFVNYCRILNISLVWLMTGEKSYENRGFDLPEKIGQRNNEYQKDIA